MRVSAFADYDELSLQVVLALDCKGETSLCWIQKAKPFASMGRAHIETIELK